MATQKVQILCCAAFFVLQSTLSTNHHSEFARLEFGTFFVAIEKTRYDY
jgi:hypothetical protein